MKIIEVIADAGHHDTIASIAKQQQVEDIWFGANNEDGRIVARLLVSPENRQSVLDALQTSDNYRILTIPLDTSLPKSVETDIDNPEDPLEEKIRKKAALMSRREKIHTQVEKDTQLNSSFILLIALSAIVASIGLLENNVAIIVGAMVIAPLLGPNIAFSLGTSLGEKTLVINSRRTATKLAGSTQSQAITTLIYHYLDCFTDPVGLHDISTS